ncbi:adenylate/guanylate cyclase domain-containing protein [Deltaproteobacteria bacterium TL4]
MNIPVFFKIILSYLILLILIGFIGIYNLLGLDHAIENYDNLLNSSEIADSVRTIQVDFKKQVQEWKDVLIRGHVPEDFDKYYSQFLAQYKKVRDRGKAVSTQNLSADELNILEQFLASHQRLQEQYLAALQVFIASNHSDYKSTDHLVRGKDRPPTDLLDTLTVNILNKTSRTKDEIQNNAKNAKLITLFVLLFTLFVASVLSVFLAYKISSLYAQQEQLSKSLSKYLSPQIYKSIFSGRREVKVESYRKHITVFFSDIQGFTQLTDTVEPETLSSLLNEYFNEMSTIALNHGGTVDKFLGDAIMIFFGDPETKGNRQDTLDCILMAIEMRTRMKTLRKKWESEGIYKPLQVRTGINSGFCTVGNFGSENRMDYTIIGGTVNLANRLESNAQPDEILISHQTYALIKDEIYCEKREKIHVKGIAYPVQTYRVVDLHEKVKNNYVQLQTELSNILDKIYPSELPDSVRAQIERSLKDKKIKMRVKIGENPTNKNES